MTEAYVTLATSDQYALGALVLAHSLRSTNTTRQLCVLISPKLSEDVRTQLSSVYDNVVPVDVLDSNDSAHLALLKRPELGVTFTKLHCWTLTMYTKCVFLDADMLAIQNSDELFDQPELSAVCDIGWPDCFNSGMFVFSPSVDTYNRLLQHAQSTGSFDGGDQGLLNTFFTSWNRLSFAYNMVASATYTYLPAYKQYGRNVKFVHFLGETKPWHQSFNHQSGTIQPQPGQEHISCHLNTWWRIFTTLVQPGLPESVCSPSVEAESSSPDCQHSQEYDTDHNIFYTHPNTYHTYENDYNFNEQVITNDQVFATHDQGQSNQTITNDTQPRIDEFPQSPLPLPSLESVPCDDEDLVPTSSTVSQCMTQAPLDEVDKTSLEIKPEETLLPVHRSEPSIDSETAKANDTLSRGPVETTLFTELSPNILPASESLLKTTDELKDNAQLSSCQLPFPTNMVPELRDAFESRGYPTESRLSFGVSGRQGVSSARFGSPFPPLICPRVPSPFSGHRAASAVSAQDPSELSQQLAGVRVSSPSLEESRKRWEQGRPDYLGEDAFAKIQAYIDAKINN